MMGWLGAPSAGRTKRGAYRLKGSSRYRSQSPSGSMVWRSLSRTRNPFFMTRSFATPSADGGGPARFDDRRLHAEGHEEAQDAQQEEVDGETPHRRHEIARRREGGEEAEGDREDRGDDEDGLAPLHARSEGPRQLE